MEAGLDDAETWAEQQWGHVKLGDARRTRRAVVWIGIQPRPHGMTAYMIDFAEEIPLQSGPALAPMKGHLSDIFSHKNQQSSLFQMLAELGRRSTSSTFHAKRSSEVRTVELGASKISVGQIDICKDRMGEIVVAQIDSL